jgi:hypothetical protein
MTAPQLTDPQFRDATRRIQRRAERNRTEEALARTFVPNRVLDELGIDQNQLIFGRRGVGKTHTLKQLLADLTTQGRLAIYLDCLQYGSGLANEGSPKTIGAQFFRGLLLNMSDVLYEHLMRKEAASETMKDRLLSSLSNLSECAAPRAGDGTFNYINITNYINQALDCLLCDTLHVLVDEWAAIPEAAQPYFAEYLKRGLFSNKRITVKIAVVDYMHTLETEIEGARIGLERSADVFGDVRMDRHFVWDEDSVFVENFFAGVLYNHLAVELRWDLALTPSEKRGLVVSTCFTQENVLTELCRACEGNARDFLILFGYALTAFCNHEPKQRHRIGIPDVNRAAADLYRQDKAAGVSAEPHLDQFLSHLVEDVIRNKKSRSFMVPYRLRQHPLLRRLYSARLLHLQEREWSHPSNPGERYSIVTMDYGSYVTLKGTKQEVSPVLYTNTADGSSGDEDLVPVDDRRSIRRIVITEDVLQRFHE